MINNVLLIDNDPGIPEVGQEILGYAGFQVAAYAGADDIVSLAQGSQPDMIIMDYRLDGQDGGELCRQQKGSPLTSHIPVILY